ncbi:hypothetical protein [Streptomyces sp. NPDC007172]|uniref:hypothetical protein n=1 Tax=Streptomyces sp. NPDC007172 TaxID=3364776 RepID=UPI0036B03B96
MTTRHDEGTGSSALPGWRVQRIDGEAVHLTHAGRIALPLAVFEGAQHRSDVPLVLPAAEAEVLYAELGRLLYPRAEEGTAS